MVFVKNLEHSVNPVNEALEIIELHALLCVFKVCKINWFNIKRTQEISHINVSVRVISNVNDRIQNRFLPIGPRARFHLFSINAKYLSSNVLRLDDVRSIIRSYIWGPGNYAGVCSHREIAERHLSRYNVAPDLSWGRRGEHRSELSSSCFHKLT